MNPWTLRVGSGLIVALLLLFITSPTKRLNFFRGIGSIFKAIGKAISAFLTFSIPIWIILTAIVALILIAKFISWLPKAEEIDSPMHYTRDRIKDWVFQWSYSANNKDIIYLNPICEQCNCLLSRSTSSVYVTPSDYLYCPKCESRFSSLLSQDVENIRKIIMSKITTGEYKESPYYKGQKK